MESSKASTLPKNKAIVKNTAKNLLKKCMLNLKKNFSENEQPFGSPIDLFKPNFDFTLKSTKSKKDAYKDLSFQDESELETSLLKRDSESLHSRPGKIDMIDKAKFFVQDDSDDDSPLSYPFIHMDSRINGEVRSEYNEVPEIKRPNCNSVHGSKSTKSNENSEKNSSTPKRLCEAYPQMSRKDFEVLKFIGKGSFSMINLAKFKENDKLYALKQCSKNDISR
mmetsp:Transcript_16821/g.18741  ORF Transcript_16821/g.18741 Transcript_16821/m.18741 type:complete len:223 (-) Transcript_16821:873-1541(-)